MAIGIGFLVGMCVRLLGCGSELTFGITGALLALFGCILGNMLSLYITLADMLHISISEAAKFAAFDLFVKSMSAMDLLFYGLASYEGFKFSTFGE